MAMRMRRRTAYLVTVAAMVAMVGGWALAASSVTSGPSQVTNVTTTTPTGFTTASLSSAQVVMVSSTIAGYLGAGTQSASTSALAGTTLVLGVCATGPCVENHNAVNGNAATAGNYAEQLVVAVTQPASTGSATGFDIQVELNINSNTLVFGYAYFSTGVSTAATSQTVDVYLFVDLGVTAAPLVNSISVQFNGCLSASACP